MSKLFSDPVYKDMQESEDRWLELAIEPYHFPLATLIHSLPAEISLTLEDVMSIVGRADEDYYMRISLMDALKLKVEDFKLDYREQEYVNDAYDLQVSDNCIINFETMTMEGTISMVKKKGIFLDEEIPTIVANLVCQGMSFNDRGSDRSEVISRMNEIMELIGATEQRSSRSIRKKADDIKATTFKILSEDKWRIRDYSIARNMVKWMVDYCNEGNMHSLMNFTRLKCMTHKDKPIYSMEEIK